MGIWERKKRKIKEKGEKQISKYSIAIHVIIYCFICDNITRIFDAC